MDELGQHLWGNRDEITRCQQPGQRGPRARVLAMLRHLRRDQKAGVEAMDHARPSSPAFGGVAE